MHDYDWILPALSPQALNLMAVLDEMPHFYDPDNDSRGEGPTARQMLTELEKHRDTVSDKELRETMKSWNADNRIETKIRLICEQILNERHAAAKRKRLEEIVERKIQNPTFGMF